MHPPQSSSPATTPPGMYTNNIGNVSDDRLLFCRVPFVALLELLSRPMQLSTQRLPVQADKSSGTQRKGWQTEGSPPGAHHPAQLQVHRD
mmetsp:Transcript_19426/g.34305  ORF Transcript_19426/g.34305 Transcript_19426/m.34305 type:complete len:90 (-) Transcript_19426:12-281(-)